MLKWAGCAKSSLQTLLEHSGCYFVHSLSSLLGLSCIDEKRAVGAEAGVAGLVERL
jgi:hypothetical protein